MLYSKKQLTICSRPALKFSRNDWEGWKFNWTVPKTTVWDELEILFESHLAAWNIEKSTKYKTKDDFCDVIDKTIKIKI